jgi:hypothetical protein
MDRLDSLESAMTGTMESLGSGEIEPLILRALVRKLVAKGVLSQDDVRALLFDAAKGLDVDGSRLTAGAAHDILEEHLVPAFLGT